jgi:hypothetical protein
MKLKITNNINTKILYNFVFFVVFFSSALFELKNLPKLSHFYK